MWIVRLALRRTYTFVVMALLIGAGRGQHQPHVHGHLPGDRHPGRRVVWQYTGMPAERSRRASSSSTSAC